MKLRICFSASLLGALLATPVELGAQDDHAPTERRYHLVDLGTLGGPNAYLPMLPPYHDFLPAASISRNGTFAGYADTDITDHYKPLCFNGDCYVSHAVAWKHGKVTDLGALPGAPGSSSAATWISDNGLIVGMSLNGDIDPLIGSPSIFAVLWKNGRIINLGTLENGYESAALSVNSAGQVVGRLASNNFSDANSLLGVNAQTRAFLWQNGAMQDIGTLPGGTDAMALFINDRGQIVGQSYSANSVVTPAFGCAAPPLSLFGFFWDKGKMTDLGTLGGSCTFPYSLNIRGEVVGQSNLQGDTTSHPFLWRPGEQMKDLGTLGGNYGFAEWLNDTGTVVGTATNQGDQALIAFQWKDGAMTNLGVLEGDACSAADAINSEGLVVGGSGFNEAAFFPACTDTVEHAVMWDRGRMVDLNNFVPPGDDLTLNEAFFVNDDDEIAGVGVDCNGNQHTFLLIACSQDDSACRDGAEHPTYRPVPNVSKPASNRNTLRRLFRHESGPLSGTYTPSTSSARNAVAIRDRSIVEESDNKTDIRSLDSSEPLGAGLTSRFETAPRCGYVGRPCSEPGVYNTCCAGLKCVFHGGSTRVGYMCE